MQRADAPPGNRGARDTPSTPASAPVFRRRAWGQTRKDRGPKTCRVPICLPRKCTGQVTVASLEGAHRSPVESHLPTQIHYVQVERCCLPVLRACISLPGIIHPPEKQHALTMQSYILCSVCLYVAFEAGRLLPTVTPHHIWAPIFPEPKFLWKLLHRRCLHADMATTLSCDWALDASIKLKLVPTGKRRNFDQ